MSFVWLYLVCWLVKGRILGGNSLKIISYCSESCRPNPSKSIQNQIMFGSSSSLMRRHNANVNASTNDNMNGNDENETVQIETILNEYTRACQVYGCQWVWCLCFPFSCIWYNINCQVASDGKCVLTQLYLLHDIYSANE